MPDLDERLRGTDRIPVPDLWAEAQRLAATAPIRKTPGLRYRVVTAAVALGVAALAFALLLRAFSGERTPLATNGSSPNGAIATVGRGPDKLPGVQNIDVIAIDPATGAHVDLTPEPARESEPAWSAAGSRVAFMRTWSTGTPGSSGRCSSTRGCSR